MQPKVSNLQPVEEYLRGPFTKIGGWCIPELWNVIQAIHQLQDSLGCHKPVAEIGVFHGKFLIGLALTKRNLGSHYAIDVFNLQQFNLDGAGQGNLDRLRENINMCGLRDDEIRFKQADSMNLTEDEIADMLRTSGGGFSMFSVDGCHMVEHTINDFRIAMRLTCPEGVIFVDDYLNADWPGVHEGIVKLFLTDNPRFVPVAYLCNKLVMCHISYHANFLRHIREFVRDHYPTVRCKLVKRFGYDCINVHPDFPKKQYLITPNPSQ